VNQAPAAAPATVPDGPIDVATLFQSLQVQEVLDELDRELVGLASVKRRIRELAAYLVVERLRRETGLASERPVLHMSFTGKPGTGKTTVALRMAEILHRLGYVRRPHVVVASRDDMVGQYVGHTAPRTKEILKKALGGVLFIDEAYYLYRPENDRDYGQEAVEILLQVMEQQRDDLVVIFAGYRDRMAAFFRSNPGLRSRTAHHIDFADFSVDELMEIAELMLSRQAYEFDEESRAAFREYIRRRMEQPLFANARSVRNAIDRMKLRHANRIAQGGLTTRAELARIDAADVLSSSVFKEGAHPA
jgi:probable Rubsico expression protein CbbX